MSDKQKTDNQSLSVKPPVVVVMGHVDHGKTTLLDTIRKTQVAAKEFGLITQHIGAYQATIQTKEGPKIITFIDTPGHEAFSAMRSRGVTVADIGILVVAADDSVKPQTVEAINHIKQAGIPMIVAVNKIDLPTADVNRVKKDLAAKEVYVEGYGGDIPIVEISAKTGKGLDDLLEVITLVAELEELQSQPDDALYAPIIESRLDKGRGPVATVIVQRGTMQTGNDYFIEGQKFRVRALLTDTGAQLPAATPGMPCEVIGLSHVPQVGSMIESQAQAMADQLPKRAINPLEALLEANKNEVIILLKGDVSGSVEAIIEQIAQLGVRIPTPKLRVVQSGTGDITDSDVLYARATKAIIVGFNVRITAQARTLAGIEEVPYKVYTLIYELIEDLTALLESGALVKIEKPKGEAIVQQVFEGTGKVIFGVKVTEGRLRVGENVKLIHNDQGYGSAKIKSLRHLKDDVREITKNMEAGVVFEGDIAIQAGDVLQYAP